MRAKLRLDYADAIGGCLLILGGIWFALYALNYNVGTARRMGPGYFPVIIGGLIGLFGLACVLGALRRSGALPRIEWRPFMFICGAVLAFGLTIERLGLVPGTLVLVALAALSEREFRPVSTAVLAVVLCGLGVGIFSWGLGIPMPVFRWGV